ncbi:NAD(P)-dependent oxidoreductase [Actinomycetospora chiangmaiensis]|uniref:NAD(P)-dependent oxidoreductase n=1 Tax=Actinomycetospora chiangmaiensis TaxID=402650 RepID=UPI00035F8F8B|nr:NAD(P)-dependent oxidoreductase [Actinomycetospora chiangmaiensis]
MTTVGIHAPGAMGTALARCVRAGGHEVLTTAVGRSPATGRRLADAGIPDAGSLDAVVAGADVLVSVVPPGQARDAAAGIAAACGRTGARPLVVEANAVAPDTVVAIAADLPDLVDAAISGPPPTPEAEQPTRVFLSGARAEEVAGLAVPGVAWVVLGATPGAASATKMCTASVRKGFTGLLAQALLTADHHGVLDAVLADLRLDFPTAGVRPAAVAATKAWRFVDEMTAIADTQAGAGLTRALFDGFAEVYGDLATSASGDRRPEDLPDTPDVGDLRPRGRGRTGTGLGEE